MHRGAVLLAAALLAGQGVRAEDPMELQRCIWRCLSAHGPNTNPAYHQCVSDICTGPEPAAAPVQSTPWSFIDALLAQALDVRAGEGGATLFPDHADPNQASAALGFHYFGNRSGGNAIELNIGLFQRIPSGWRYSGPVAGLFGIEPREVSFPPGRIEVTTTVLGPGEPRCCPTQVARWSVDIATRTATRLR